MKIHERKLQIFPAAKPPRDRFVHLASEVGAKLRQNGAAQQMRHMRGDTALRHAESPLQHHRAVRQRLPVAVRQAAGIGGVLGGVDRIGVMVYRGVMGILVVTDPILINDFIPIMGSILIVIDPIIAISPIITTRGPIVAVSPILVLHSARFPLQIGRILTTEIGTFLAAESSVMSAEKLLNPAVIHPEENRGSSQRHRFDRFIEGDEVEHIRGNLVFPVSPPFQDTSAERRIAEKVLISEIEGAGDAFDEGQREFQGVAVFFPPKLHFARHFFQRGKTGDASFPREQLPERGTAVEQRFARETPAPEREGSLGDIPAEVGLEDLAAGAELPREGGLDGMTEAQIGGSFIEELLEGEEGSPAEVDGVLEGGGEGGRDGGREDEGTPWGEFGSVERMGGLWGAVEEGPLLGGNLEEEVGVGALREDVGEGEEAESGLGVGVR